jgi:hypothetical protein
VLSVTSPVAHCSAIGKVIPAITNPVAE